MAELLVHAKGHWMDNMTQAEIDALDDNRRASRNARTQFGDIIVVKPDGWGWGNEERLPNYIVVQLPGVSVDDVQQYVEGLWDRTDPDNPIMLKKRKYKVPSDVVQNQIDLQESIVDIAFGKGGDPIGDFTGSIIEKTS
jgi:hypothetical protein